MFFDEKGGDLVGGLGWGIVEVLLFLTSIMSDLSDKEFLSICRSIALSFPISKG